ncbi:hypothetical protein GCM10010197_17320 [Nocardioides luteus]|uniref:Uncharacterized protein n=1 Tax=Nocardioides luteus TaxID=1844 RepID=A0ABQ5SVM9_9ACTN|nr:hypothetical protein GCM10010197_17320 [Nocardioides luteus]GLJ67916.1 hypothetical protein GCM10017579_19520 [Nocardioides luteus]
MAYEASAANRIHSAETSSPRDRASTTQQTAPTTATTVQMAMDFQLGPERGPEVVGWAVDVDMVSLGFSAVTVVVTAVSA